MSAKPRIERAALEVFVTEGVDATTTRTIAARAGVSEGAIYRHWKSKDELALGLFMDSHRRLSTLIAEERRRRDRHQGQGRCAGERLLRGGRRGLAALLIPPAAAAPFPALLSGGRPRPGDPGRGRSSSGR